MDKNRVPCAWFRLPPARVFVLMRLALRPRASCGDRRCCCRNAPDTRRFLGWAHIMIRFGWLLQALCLLCFYCVYNDSFFGFRRDDGGFQKK